MGAAFAKGRRNSQTHDISNPRNSNSSKSRKGIKGNKNIISNVPYRDNKGLNVNKASLNTIKPNNTGSSSSSVTNQQHPPYLNGNSLNPKNTEINTGLTASVVPSNSISERGQQSAANKNNNTTDKHLNTLSMHKLITFGWIRQNCIDPTIRNKDIPSNILETCFQFIYTECILFCFIASENEKISTLQAIDMNNIYKSQYHLPPSIQQIGDDTNGICIYSKQYLSFPPSIVNQYKLDTLKNRYHAIFKCGSQNSRDAKCIILPQQQFNYKISNRNKTKSDQMLEAYIWDLPEIPSAIASFGNTVSYSHQHGLITIGGAQPDSFLGAGSYSGVLQLKWTDSDIKEDDEEDIDDYDNLKWRSLRRMNTGRAHASSTFFTDAHGVEYLFICGGDLNGSVEVYNFEENVWKDVANTNVSRECGGIYYDSYENQIYLGGGHGAQKKIECYDIYRDEWNCFPNTKFNHDFYPSLFKTSHHYDILYIVSPKSNLCEYIDKREGKWNNGKWDVIYDHELHDEIFKIPNKVDFDQFRFIH